LGGCSRVSEAAGDEDVVDELDVLDVGEE